MAIAASRPLDMPRQQAFWLLHLAGWSAYFAQGCLYAVAHGKPSGYWVVPLTAATTGAVVTLGLRYLLRACWGLPPRRLLAVMEPANLASSAVMPQDTLSAAVLGNKYITLTRPGLCPARPRRCIVPEIVLGQPT